MDAKRKKAPEVADLPDGGTDAPEGYYRLFPAEANAGEDWQPIDPQDVLEVRLYRLAGQEHIHLDNYSPAELADEKAIRALHGGGTYLAVCVDGRRGKVGRVMRRRTFTLRGAPIVPKEEPPPHLPAAPPSPAPSSPSSGDALPAWAQALIALGPAFLEYMRGANASSRDDARAHQALLIQAMQGNQAAQAELVKALAPVARETAGAQPAGGTPLGQIKEVVGVMKDLGYKLPKEPDIIDKALEGLLPMFAIKMMGPGGGMPGMGGATGPN